MNLIATLRMKSSEDGTVILQVAAARRPRKQEQPQDLGHVRMHAVRTGGAEHSNSTVAGFVTRWIAAIAAG